MTFSNRLWIFAAIIIAGLIAWQWNAAIDASRDLAEEHASVAPDWWPFLWPGLLGIVGITLFWDDVARVWRKDRSI